MDENTVESKIWIQAPVERVWEAITTSEQIRQWWGGDYWEITALQPGAEVLFGHENDRITARVAAVEPPREFALDWPPLPALHSTAFSTTYRLEAENGGTRVTVRESGFAGLPPEIRQERYDSTAKGYQTVLQGLKDFVEQGGG